jgi:hypothetical protein
MGFLYDMLFRGIFHLYLVTLELYYSGFFKRHNHDHVEKTDFLVEWISRFNIFLIGGTSCLMIVLGIIFYNHRNRRAMCTMMAKPYSLLEINEYELE